ncbi:MAG: carboxymuconolactone decarboxylase family protein [Desulfatibacillum sp.]|nr:carboxymuconolactone decarboxylase family protein [Desulfatibacillum sp.]
MKDIQMRTFETVGEFVTTAANMVKGPTFVTTFLKMDAKFREKVILCVSITNNCGVCTKVHTLVGLRAGLTEEDIQKLITLYKKDYSLNEWLALRWARDWAVLRGQAPSGNNARAFGKDFTPREQAFILKICRMMKMANYTSNYLFAVPYLEEKTSQSRKGLLGLLSGPVEEALTQAVLAARCRAARATGAAADACAGILGIDRCVA